MALIPRTLAHDPQPPPATGHASEWLARPIGFLGADPAERPPALEPTDVERAAAAATIAVLPDRFLALHPGSGSPAKNWPADRFAALAERSANGRAWLLVEGPADAASVAPLRGLSGVVVASDLPPRTLGAVLARAGVFVGNDSGVTHLAAAWGAPTVALFGPTDPSVWAPLGPRVEVVRSGDGTMAGIAVDDVSRATSAALGLPSG